MVARRESEYHEASGVQERKIEDVYWKAYEKSVTPMKAKLEELGVEMVPALYQVVFEY